MDEILRLYRDVTYDRMITRIYSCMLLKSGEYEPAYSMEELKKFGIVHDTHQLPKDYPLIESEVINTMDELLDILSIFNDNKIYLCLDSYEFREALMERVVGKQKLVEIIESANDEQLKKLAILEAKMSKDDCRHRSMLTIFLASSHDSNKIKRVLNVVLKHENLKADVVEDFRGYGLKKVHKNFYNNNIQISVDSFERLLNAKYKDETFYWSNDDLHELLELLKGGVKCCSEDIKKNKKKIDLRCILEKGKIKVGEFPSIPSVGVVSELVNFVFTNINEIQLNRQFMVLVYHSFLAYYEHGYINNKRLGIVIATILQKNNFVYNNVSTMYQDFEAECKKYGIDTACDRDDIFLVERKLYLVEKSIGVVQFNNVEDFFEYVCSNTNTQEGKLCFDLLIRFTNGENNIYLADEELYLVGKDVGIVTFDSLDNFLESTCSNINTEEGKRYAQDLANLFDYNYSRYINNMSRGTIMYRIPIGSKINDDCCMVSNFNIDSIGFYSLCLISKILESQNISESLLNKLENMPSQWDCFNSFCFKFLYVHCFSFEKVVPRLTSST